MPWLKTYKRIDTRLKYEKCASYEYYKNIKSTLTIDQLKILWFRDKADKMIKPSIDRINSKGNYTFENCRYIELSVNSKRGRNEAK